MTTTYSVHKQKQNINTYGPITSSYEPTTQKTTIPFNVTSDVTQSGSETQTSRAPTQRKDRHRKSERHPKRTTPKQQITTEHSVYTHKFPRHHFEFTYPFDDEKEHNPKSPQKSQKESASEKKPQRVQNAKFAYEQGADSNTNSTQVPHYGEYSSAESKRETQAQASSEEDEEKATEKSEPQKSPFYNFFHDEEVQEHEETTPKPKRQKQKPQKEEDSAEEGKNKSFLSPEKFQDIPNPFADPNFDFNAYLHELRATQRQRLRQRQRQPNESQDQRRILYPNQALPQNLYSPYRPYAAIPVQETTTLLPISTINPYVNEYQTTYLPDETIRHLEANPALPLVVRNALKSLNGNVDQPYRSNTALNPVQAKPGSFPPVPLYKSPDRGPQTFKNSQIIAYNLNTHKAGYKPGQGKGQQQRLKQPVATTMNDDYYYYYYDDEPQQTKQTNNNAKLPPKKPADDEYYYYEYYDYPEEKNKTKPNNIINYEYVPPHQPPKVKPAPRNPFLSNPNSLPSQNHNSYKPPNDNINLFTIKPVHVPLTTIPPFSFFSPTERNFYTTARIATTVQPTVGYTRQRLTTVPNSDRDSRRNQPIFYNR